jgi:hypothetical protein
MPRPDPVPSTRSPLVERFLRILKWLALFSIAIAAIAVALVAYGEGTHDVNLLVATALGVGLTVLLGTGLMVLTFLSSRSGHDDEVSRTHAEDDR